MYGGKTFRNSPLDQPHAPLSDYEVEPEILVLDCTSSPTEWFWTCVPVVSVVTPSEVLLQVPSANDCLAEDLLRALPFAATPFGHIVDESACDFCLQLTLLPSLHSPDKICCRLPVASSVLGARCEPFKALLSQSRAHMRESHTGIMELCFGTNSATNGVDMQLGDVGVDDVYDAHSRFRSFLMFIGYLHGDMYLGDVDDVLAVLALADQYQATHLLLLCESVLMRHVDIDNAALLWRVAHKNSRTVWGGLPNLEAVCLSVLVRHNLRCSVTDDDELLEVVLHLATQRHLFMMEYAAVT